MSTCSQVGASSGLWVRRALRPRVGWALNLISGWKGSFEEDEGGR